MAVSEIDKHRRRWEENPKGLTFAPYADALRKAGEAEQALDVLRAGLEYHPDYIPANIVLGRCHLDLGDDAAAGAAFERVLGLDPENVIALKALADVSERAQHWPEATKWLNQLLGIDRGNDSAREQLSRVQVAEHEASLRPVDAVAGLDVVHSGAEFTEAAGALEPVPAFKADAVNLEQSTEVELDEVSAVETIELERTPEAEFSPLDMVTVSLTEPIVEPAPSVDVLIEEQADPFLGVSSRTTSGGEFAVDDAAESFRAAEPPMGEVAGAGAQTQAPSWAEMGTGEFVPAIFAADTPAVPTDHAPIELMGGIELELPVADATFAMADAAPAEPSLVEGFESHAVTDVVPALVDGLETDAVTAPWSSDPADADTVSIEPLHEAAEAPDAVLLAVAVPSPVSALALQGHEVAALDQAARRVGFEALASWRDRTPTDVLGTAPQADPAVIAALAAAEVAPVAEAAEHAGDDSGPQWIPWTWGEHDPDLHLLASIPEYVPLIPPPAPPAPRAVETAARQIPAPSVPTPEEVTAAPVGDEDAAAVPPGFAAPVLVTAAMAALYEGQGHLREALATYRELEQRTPGAHRDRIAQLESKLAALPAPPVYAARLSGGQPVREFFGAVLRTMPPALVTAGSSAGDDGSALRKADEPVSLGRLFGEEQVPRPQSVAARTASYDEFYGAAAPAAESAGRDDLEQFHAWLQGLKT